MWLLLPFIRKLEQALSQNSILASSASAFSSRMSFIMPIKKAPAARSGLLAWTFPQSLHRPFSFEMIGECVIAMMQVAINCKTQKYEGRLEHRAGDVL